MGMGWLERKGKKLKGVETTDRLTSRAQAENELILLNSFPEAQLRLGDSLVKKASLERTNQLESRDIFEEKEINEKLKQVLLNSDFNRLRKKAASDVFLEGIKWLAIVPVEDSFMVDCWDIVNKTRFGSHFTFLELMTSSVVEIKNQVVPLRAEMKWSNGTTELKFLYTYEDEDYEDPITAQHGATRYFKTDTMLGAPIRSNFEELGEVQAAGLSSSVDHLNYLSQLSMEESMRTRTMFELNSNFTNYQDENAFEKQIRKGYTGSMSDAFNQKLQSGMSIPVSGSQSQTFTQLAYKFLEDTFKERLGVFRDSTSTGAQKHTLEITLQNQAATEMLWAIKSLREQDYKQLIKSLCSVLGIADESEKVELRLSLIEELKIKSMEENLAAKENKGSQAPQRLEQKGDK